MVIGFDCNAAIAAFQKNPPANIAVHRARVRAFLESHPSQRILFPAVALSEYLWKADRAGLDEEIRRVIAGRMFPAMFTDQTAQIAANLGRDYANGRKLGEVAKQTCHDRVALKLDLLIVATALEHSVQHFLTGDPGCHAVALFANLNAHLIDALPDPPPPRPMLPPTEPLGRNLLNRGLFDDLDNPPSD